MNQNENIMCECCKDAVANHVARGYECCTDCYYELGDCPY